MNCPLRQGHIQGSSSGPHFLQESLKQINKWINSPTFSISDLQLQRGGAGGGNICHQPPSCSLFCWCWRWCRCCEISEHLTSIHHCHVTDAPSLRTTAATASFRRRLLSISHNSKLPLAPRRQMEEVFDSRRHDAKQSVWWWQQDWLSQDVGLHLADGIRWRSCWTEEARFPAGLIIKLSAETEWGVNTRCCCPLAAQC